MNKAFLTIGIILMAIMGFYTVSLISSQQTGSELNYYLLKETTEASMNDAMDTYFYRETGEMRMDKEKFLESFVKRFAANVDNSSKKYTLKFYDINETPPKVSVRVLTKKDNNTIKAVSQNGSNTASVDITSSVDMMVETKYKKNDAVKIANRDLMKDLKITSVNKIQ